ncbi:hypothetical protein YUYDRAFT_02076 [Streptomyces sp. ScaeMP-e48]|uniref:hypothetical protein n=1 Tax=Streptomyces sp. ScaeMP-e48 TaxID=1100823 RepID=UPI000823B439|nr:hypothetical protein [Streptomyces sp. ScaeMP-e48]SCK20058.1 hypothetical protein YUYDRAFT_02076 [Streptomyces sp. ScaeMP-e48]
MADDVSIVVRVRDSTTSGITAVNRSLRRLEDGAKGMDKSFGSVVSSALSLAPALLPIAAAAAPLVAGIGAASIAVGVFGAAIGPQIMAMKEATEAEKKWTDAVEKHGASSAQAAQAEAIYLDAVLALPPATREAAAALTVLKDEYEDWSNALADDTMPVATKAFALFGGLFPKLTPMVKGTSRELDRFVTIAAGGVQSRGFDRFMKSFTEFSTVSLAKGNQALIHFTRTLDTGKVGGGISEFMSYARENGPLVGDTLMQLSEALVHLLVAASDVGVGMLQFVNVLTSLVSAIPTSALTNLIQLAIAIKLVRLAMAGGAAIATGMAAVRTQITLAGTAAIGASGALATLRVSFMAMSVAARTAVAATGIGALVLVLVQLASIGEKTPPNVDRLTTSLGKLADTGKVSGEAARAFGTDLSGLADSLRVISRPDIGQGIDAWIGSIVGIDTREIKEAKADLDGADDALANLVRSGHADLAAAALDRLGSGMSKNGMSAAELRGQMDNYQNALADVAYEQKLAADAMGLFGQQAIQTQQKLDAQKASADGLRQAIQQLNDVNRAALGGMVGFEGAIDAAAKAAAENADVLTMVGGQLDLNSEKSRTAATALTDLAAKTDSATASARESGASWATVNGIYERGRKQLVANAMQMGLNRNEAQQLAAQILKTPDKTAKLRGNLEDLKVKLADAKTRLKNAPSSKTAKIKGEISDLRNKVAQAKAALNQVKSKTVSVMVQYRSSQNPSSFAKSIGALAHGGVVGAAGGGPRSRMTLVGEQGPELVDLAPGSRVRSNPDTKRMLSGGHAGGSGQPIVVQLALDGRTLAEVLIDPLRGQIQSLTGGNVQSALGRG